MNERKKHLFILIVLTLALIIGIPVAPLSAFADGEEEVELIGSEDVTEIANEGPTTAGPSAEELAKEKAAKTKASYQDQIANINTELQELEKQQTEIKKNLYAVQGEKEEKQAVVNDLGAQIGYTQHEINLLQNKTYLLELDIQEKEENIDEKQMEYDKNYKIFLGRFRTMSMHDNTSTLGLILGTDNYVDFLTTTDTVNRIADHDREIMETLQIEKKELEEEQIKLQESQESLQITEAATAAKQNALAGQQAQAIVEVQSVAGLQSQFEAELAASQQKSAQMQAQINEIYRQIKMSENPYVGGIMQWPVSGHYDVSSRYGLRFGGSDFHSGMDITGGGVMGAPVVAANDGTVVSTNWSHSPGYGYGIFIILDHGGNTSTLYAHLSNISVSVGDAVAKGQTIGSVGSTGWSTGPHLHFEVRINGGHVNPQPYVTA